MNSIQVVCLVTATVLLIFVGTSNAGMDKHLKKTSETAKYVTSQSYQNDLEKMIMTSSDESNLIAKATIDAIQEAASKCKNDGVPSLLVDKTTEGILATIRIVAGAERSINRSIDKALDMAAEDPGAAIDTIKNGIKSNIDIIYISGLSIHNAQGSALAFVGGAAINELKNAEKSLLSAGIAALEGYDMAEKLAILGLEAGGAAAEKGLKAARIAVASGGTTAYIYVLKTAQSVFDGMRYAVSKGFDQNDLVPGIERSLKSSISIESTAGLNAIDKLNNGLKSVTEVSTNKTVIDSATIMNRGIIATISENGNVIANVKKVLNDVEKIASQDTKAAITLLNEGFETAIDNYIQGAGSAVLAMGASGRMVGEDATESLFPALVTIEYGVIATYRDLMIAKESALNGLRAGGKAAVRGISSAIKSCEAAENSLFTQYSDGGMMGLNVLQNLHKPSRNGSLLSLSLSIG